MAYPTPPAADGRYPVLGPFRPVVPIYVVGDSHSLAFSRLTFDEAVTGATFGTRARYIPSGFTGEAFWSAGGGLHPELIAALEYEGLLRDGRAIHLSTADRIDLSIALATEQPQVPPVLVIMCGDIDVRGAVVPLLRDDRDFIPPTPTQYPHTDQPLVPFDLIRRVIAGRIDPLIQGTLQLQAAGFTRTYLHCVVPPTVDDARFRLIHGYDCPAATRYKAARAVNDYLAAECGKSGIPFVDIWPETTTPEGYLRPEYELDGVHLPRAAARVTLHKLLEHVLGRTYMAANYPRYELYYRRCLGRPAAPPPVPPTPPAAVDTPASPTEPPATPPSPVELPLDSAPPPRRTRSAASRLVRRAARMVLPHAVRHSLRVASGRAHRPVPAPVVAVTETAPVIAPTPPPPAPPPPTPPPLVEVANRPPDICTAPDLPPLAAGVEPWVTEAVGRFRADGLAVLRVDRELVERWREMLDFSLSMSNVHVRWDWTGHARRSYTTDLQTAALTEDFCRELHALLTRPAMEEFFTACLGCPATVLNCRPVRSLAHEKAGFGPQSWHGDGCPAGIIRGVLYLTDVDEGGGPFQYRGPGGEVTSVTGPAGSFLVFDANRLIHRGCPPTARERYAIDLVLQARWPGEPLRILNASTNSWPADPFVYSTAGMTVYPPDPQPARFYRTW